MKRWITVAGAIAILAFGATVASGQSTFIPPNWKKRPSPEDLNAVWPAEAHKRGIEGSARLECKVTVDGRLRDCSATEETPAGMNFGSAALALVPQFEMTPAKVNGQPVERSVKFKVNFSCDGGCGEVNDQSETILRNVPWISAPSMRDVVDAYPTGARARRIAGAVTFDCTFRSDGSLGNCASIRETSAEFNRAGRRLIPLFRGPVSLPSGRPISRSHTHLVITFSERMLDKDAGVSGQPELTKIPSDAQLLAAYPRKAVEGGVLTGRGVMRCAIVAGGGLTDCRVSSEEPAGQGFGEATLSLREHFAVSTWTDEGLPTIGGSVLVPVRFVLRSAPAQPPAQ